MAAPAAVEERRLEDDVVAARASPRASRPGPPRSSSGVLARGAAISYDRPALVARAADVRALVLVAALAG